MIYCVDLLLAGLLTVPVSATAETRVRDGVAALWRVEAARVQLAWPRSVDGVRDDAEVSLGGGGREGWLTATFQSPGAPPQVVRVRAGLRVAVPVAASGLVSGTLLRPDDIAWQERTVWGPPRGAAQEPAPVAGWRVRRPLTTGEPLAWPAVAARPVIELGAPVTLVWEQDGVRISRPGVAMNRAVTGGWVRVRVEGRADRVVGRATAGGEVSLAGGMR
jgi:flagella basal body P-ring formation protein FlgA